MTIQPLVSICIPNRNYGRFLPDALDGLLSQAYPRIEVIVVDDGSIDESREVLERYADRIKVDLREGSGQGPAASRAFALSTGEIVAFHDSDDVLEPDAVERIVAAFAEPSVTLVLGRLRDIDAHGAPLLGIRPPAGSRMQEGDLRGLIAAHANFIWPETTGQSFRRTAIESFLPLPAQLAPDLYLSNMAALAGHVAVLDRPIGRYRVHGANKSAAPSRRGVDWLDGKLDERRLIDRDVRVEAFRRGVTTASPDDERPSSAPHDHIRAGLELARRRLTGDPGALAWAVEGIRSIATHPQFSVGSRAKHVGWFASTAVAPRTLARRLVLGRYPFAREAEPSPVEVAT